MRKKKRGIFLTACPAHHVFFSTIFCFNFITELLHRWHSRTLSQPNFLCPPVFSCWLLGSCRCWLWQDYLLWAHLCFRNCWRGKPAFCMPEWLMETWGMRERAWGLHHGYDTPLHSQGPMRKVLLAGKENDKHLEPVEAHRTCSEIFSRVCSFILHGAEFNHVIVCLSFQLHFFYRAL